MAAKYPNHFVVKLIEISGLKRKNLRHFLKLRKFEELGRLLGYLQTSL
jgi:hypothetical protein